MRHGSINQRLAYANKYYSSVYEGDDTESRRNRVKSHFNGISQERKMTVYKIPKTSDFGSFTEEHYLAYAENCSLELLKSV